MANTVRTLASSTSQYLVAKAEEKVGDVAPGNGEVVAVSTVTFVVTRKQLLQLVINVIKHRGDKVRSTCIECGVGRLYQVSRLLCDVKSSNAVV